MSSFQRDKFLESYHTGTAVPISSLLSKCSQGVGDFSDLASFGEWCADVGLDLIQILPINDTGTMSSPYSALSAFALHPIYADLNLIPGAAGFKSEIESFQEKSRSWDRVNYGAALSFKKQILQSIFGSNRARIEQNRDLRAWIAENEWLRIYAAYLILRSDLDLLPWYDWDLEKRACTKDLVQRTIAGHQDRFLFHAWTQWHLEMQFVEVKNSLEERGVYLKGDIPILMNDDSADVWANPELFNMSKRAGAPPDMFVTTGQHWGFPTYNWKEMARLDYLWWVERLKQAEKYYHLYRIDHVLGFFRIWSIPEKESTGTLGVYEPIEHPSRSELREIGLDADQIETLSSSGIWKSESVNVDQRDLISEKYLESQELKGLSKDESLKAYRDWSLIAMEGDRFAFTWYYKKSSAFKELPLSIQKKLVALKYRKDMVSEKIWEEQGRRLLGILKDSTSMLACAEDLGVVPDCVPKVLADLDILSLKIERWMPISSSGYKSNEGPVLHPKYYPRLSVCTTSVHDTDTLRAWWENENSEIRTSYFNGLDLDPNLGQGFGPEICREVLGRQMESNSLVLSIPIQDYFALSKKYYVNSPDDERINIPGTVTEFNWSYKLPFDLDEIKQDIDLRDRIRELVATRRLEPSKKEP